MLLVLWNGSLECPSFWREGELFDLHFILCQELFPHPNVSTKDKLLHAIDRSALLVNSACSVWCSCSQPFSPCRSHSSACSLAPLQGRFLPTALWQARSFALRISPSCTFTHNLRSSLKAACPNPVLCLFHFQHLVFVLTWNPLLLLSCCLGASVGQPA